MVVIWGCGSVGGWNLPQATLLCGSWARHESKIASDTWSHILSVREGGRDRGRREGMGEGGGMEEGIEGGRVIGLHRGNLE